MKIFNIEKKINKLLKKYKKTNYVEENNKTPSKEILELANRIESQIRDYIIQTKIKNNTSSSAFINQLFQFIVSAKVCFQDMFNETRLLELFAISDYDSIIKEYSYIASKSINDLCTLHSTL